MLVGGVGLGRISAYNRASKPFELPRDGALAEALSHLCRNGAPKLIIVYVFETLLDIKGTPGL